MTAPTRRSAFWVAVATWYAKRALRRRVEGIYVAGAEALRSAAAYGPVVLVANHGSWWDTFVMLVVSDHTRLHSHALMDEGNLHRLAFFEHIGARALSRSDGVRARAQIASAAALLRDPGEAMWFFADGAQRPFHARPLAFKKGAAWLALRAQATMVPCAISLIWRDRPEPAVLVSFGAPVRCDTPDLATTTLEAAVTTLLDAQTQTALHGVMPECVLVGTRDVRDNGVATRFLAALCRAPR